MKTEDQKQKVLDFFRLAFCADKAEFATHEEIEKLKPNLPIKITSSDGRGIFT